MEAGLEEERLQRERQETQWISEAEARAQVLRVKAELKAQERQAVQLESSCRAVDRSLGQNSKKLQVRCIQAPIFHHTLLFFCFFFNQTVLHCEKVPAPHLCLMLADYTYSSCC